MWMRYLLRSKQFIVLTVLNICLLFSIGIAFAGLVNRSLQSLSTWNRTESTYVAYSAAERSENCYVYYGKELAFNLSEGDGIRLNAEIYQFIEGTVYNKKSLLNESNVASGEYCELAENEIAIPERISRKYGIRIGDDLYLSGKTLYTVKFVFRDLYGIKDPSIYSTDNVVFIGHSAEKLSPEHTFALFDNVMDVYNEVYLFKDAKQEFLVNGCTYLSIDILLITLVQLGIFLGYRKSETHTLSLIRVSGDKKKFHGVLFGFNAWLTLLPAATASLLLIILKDHVLALTIMLAISIIYSVKVIVLKLKFR